MHNFLVVEKLAKHILSIPTSQIETLKRIFSIARISTSFYRCHLQTNNLHKLIFFNNNWPLDSHINYWKHLIWKIHLKQDLAQNKRTWGWIWWWNGTWRILRNFVILFINFNMLIKTLKQASSFSLKVYFVINAKLFFF